MPVALVRARQQISEPPIRQVHAVDTTEIGRLSAALADRYVIERELGRGGMATVYLARDVRHDRHVARRCCFPSSARSSDPVPDRDESRSTITSRSESFAHGTTCFRTAKGSSCCDRRSSPGGGGAQLARCNAVADGSAHHGPNS
jgi:hypothetical protein